MNQPKGSLSSVKVRFLDPGRPIEALKRISHEILKRDPNILGIYLFGSLVKGTYAPGSDADILILLKDDQRRFIDRIPEFLRHYLNAPIATDVFPYTKQEIQQMIADQNPFIMTLWKEKIILAER